MLRQTTLSQAIAKRVRVVLALADGESYATIAARAACADRFIAIWKRRFVEGGVLALADAPRAGRGHGLSAALEARIARIIRLSIFSSISLAATNHPMHRATPYRSYVSGSARCLGVACE